MERKTADEIVSIYSRNADTVYRVCMMFFKGKRDDAEDAVQTAFLKLMDSGVSFKNSEHEKAWLIVTASNVCRDMLRSSWRKKVELDDSHLAAAPALYDGDDILTSVMSLPDNCKTAVYMYYYEGFSCGEIARAMGKTTASVWGYLHKGRAMLRDALKEE